MSSNSEHFLEPEFKSLFVQPERAQIIWKKLAEGLISGSNFREIWPTISRLLADCPDPDRAFNNFERFVHANFSSANLYENLKKYPHFLEIFIHICSRSQYLADILIRHPEFFYWLVIEGINQRTSKEQILQEGKRSLEKQTQLEACLEILKRIKRREMLRIATQEFMGFADLKVTTKALSDLADAIVELVYQLHYQQLWSNFGHPQAKFAIIGLGKLGGRELNYASDIDIIFLYSQEGELQRLDGRGSTSYHQFFNLLAERIVHSLTQISYGEALYRVDTRLRPDGESGPLARSLLSYIHYYEMRGRIWERQMLIKARPIAGDQQLGQKFLEQIKPFVYPKTFFRSPLEQISQLKQQIEASITAKGTETRNIKLKRGGIRDIEFVLQAFQLLNGGRIPELQIPNTMEALQALYDFKLLSSNEFTTLSEAYQFYRTVEHRLQMLEGRQTHLLPDNEVQWNFLAKSLGIASGKELIEKLSNYENQVRKIYDSVFAVSTKVEEMDSAFLLDPDITPEKAAPLLEPLRCKNPLAILRSLHHLAYGRTTEIWPAGTKESFQLLLPHLLEALKNTPDPETTLVQFENLVVASRVPKMLYQICLENRALFYLLIRLCSTTLQLAQIFAQAPANFDILFNFENLEQDFQPDQTAQQFWDLYANLSFEEYIRQLVRMKNFEYLRIGMQDLSRKLSPEQVWQQLSDLADVTLQLCLRKQLADLVHLHPKQSLPPFGIFGLGKLGGRELNFASDLDIIFFFQEPRTGTAETAQIFTQLIQHLINAFRQITPSGFLYKIDTRLRPEGSSAPLVITTQQYLDYLRKRAQLWERQSLIKLRFIAGDATFGQCLENEVRQFVFATSLDSLQIDQIQQMRFSMEAKSAGIGAQLDIKNAPGGIVDVEFLVQMLQLLYGNLEPALQTYSTLSALSALAELGLLSKETAKFTERHFLFLRQIEKYVKVGLGKTRAVVPLHSEALDFLAYCLGFSRGEEFRKTLQEQMAKMRELFLQVFEKEKNTSRS